MSENLQPGLHPDADSLSAFIEGVLPEQERLRCLAHFAECSRCRDIVFLAQEPAAEAPAPVPGRRRWFSPVPIFAAAAAVCVAVLAFWLYIHSTGQAPARDTVARVSEPSAPPSAAQTPGAPTTETSASAAAAPSGAKRAARQPIKEHGLSPTAGVPRRTTPPSLPPPPDISVESNSAANQPLFLPSTPPPAIAPPAPAVSASINSARSTAVSSSAITGTVIDASGALVSGANVHLRQVDGTFTSDTRTDTVGQFKLSGLPAGRYELEIASAGFQRLSKQIDLKPREVAAVTSTLSIGAVTETVEVTAGTPEVQTEMSTVSGGKARRRPSAPSEPRPLPSKLPVAITLTSAKLMLAVDSNGALFFSKNAGKRWKAVKPQWSGKVVQLVNLSEQSQASQAEFQLTTDTDATWLSRDGSHWYPAPDQH